MNEPKTIEAFGSGAWTYDQDFTNTLLGRAQRGRVWKYLDAILDKNSLPINILEINCGTGEDAIHLARKGHQVLATDISAEMLNKAHSKAMGQRLNSINFLQKAIQNIEEITPEKHYDLIFSNFGGLNCLSKDELTQLPKKLKNFLTENGHIVLVLMPRYCLVEDLYMLIKGQLGSVFRRHKGSGMPVPVGDQTVHTWYYAPKFMKKIFQVEKLRVKNIMTVGFTPSYLNNYLARRPNFLRTWRRIGDLFRPVRQMAFLADHYLIHFTNTGNKD